MFSQLEKMVSEGLDKGEFNCNDAKIAAEVLFVGTVAFHHPRLLQDLISEELKN